MPIADDQQLRSAFTLHQAGRFDEAAVLYRQLISRNSHNAQALHLLGLIEAGAGRLQQARELMARSLASEPDNGYFLENYATILFQSRDYAATVETTRRAVGGGKASVALLYVVAAALFMLNRPQEALARYDELLARQPDHVAALNDRGQVLIRLKRLDEALASFDAALTRDPRYLEAHLNRGSAFDEGGRYDDAIAAYDAALAIRLDFARGWLDRGSVLRKLHRYDESLAAFDKALAIEPNLVKAWLGRGNVFQATGRHREALVAYEKAIALAPANSDAWLGRGNVFAEMRAPEEASVSFERALTLDPGNATTHWNLAVHLLRHGDFARGWQEHEWRWQTGRLQYQRRDFAQPLWLGDRPLEGRTILLHGEQGLGDTLQFCRYADLVARNGARVVLEVPPPLVRVLANLPGVAQVIGCGDPLPAFDLHCPLLSLPLAFKTTLDSVPACIPYIRADPAQVAGWRDRLGEKSGPRVALVWSGSRELANDRNRSIELAALLQLIGEPVQWLSLQKDVRETDAGVLAAHRKILDVGAQLTDFADTAAVLELTDLLITVDTSVAHLAGAMGKPVWILLPFNPDWRWMLDREDSPWYPGARLFRQGAIGDWPSVIGRVGEQLRHSFEPQHRDTPELRG